MAVGLLMAGCQDSPPPMSPTVPPPESAAGASLPVEIEAQGTWTIEAVDAANMVGTHSSIAVDASGNPRISYHDETAGTLKYARFTGSSWSIETVPDADAHVGHHTSLRLDASGNPRIAYARGTTDIYSALKYARWTGAAWSIETVDQQAQGVGVDASLALDSNGNPHISHHKAWGQQGLRYAKKTGSKWSKETVESGPGDGRGSSIEVDPSGSVHISYKAEGMVKYARRSGSTWSIEVVDPEGGREDTSLELDSAGNPHLTYRGSGGFGAVGPLKYARRSGAAWDIQVVDPLDGSGAPYSSLDFDSLGNPHIAYYDWGAGDLKYARWTGSAWAIEAVDSAGDVGSHCSLVVDGSSVVHISYYDETNGDLKYARQTPPL